jgi:parallel beta-helix repeat protein
MMAARGGGTIELDAGEYRLSAPLIVRSGVTLSGSGSTLIANQNNTHDPLLISVPPGSRNVCLRGLRMVGSDYNRVFASMALAYKAFNIVFDRCSPINAMGIAIQLAQCEESGVVKSDFENCGVAHLISGNPKDRKQAIAIYGNGRGNFALDCRFRRIGLDCISATEQMNVCISRNEIDETYTGSIYLSRVHDFTVEENRVSNGTDGGNGIDCINVSDGKISKNWCSRNGAGGIMVADSENVEILENVCRDNWQGHKSLHNGGIVLVSTRELKNIHLAGNICGDTRRGKDVTQHFAIGRYGNGVYSDIRIDSSNQLMGYDANGHEHLNNVFQAQQFKAIG